MFTFLKYVFYAVILLVVLYIGFIFYSTYWGEEPIDGETIVVTES